MRRAFAVTVMALLALGMVLAAARNSRAHTASIDSPWSSLTPTIDGTLAVGEWGDAIQVDLGAVPRNEVPALLLVKNNDTFLWIAFDAIGDATADPIDRAAFMLDTGHDLAQTPGREDAFDLALSARHLVYGFGWEVHDDPINESLPGHAGLAAVRGFGPSDASAADHRTYEFQIPLVLLGVSAGDTIGFLGGNWEYPAVFDQTLWASSSWPSREVWAYAPWDFGDLNLGVRPSAVGVVVTPSVTTARGFSGQTLWYNVTIRNVGIAGDTFDVGATGAWPPSLWEASGLTPLADSEGDGMPDSGNVTAGGTARIVVKVTIPPTATGCDVANLTAASSWDLSVTDSAIITSCRGPASFRPPYTEDARDTDTPLNGLFDVLEIGVVIDVAKAGTYLVHAELTSLDGTLRIDDAWPQTVTGGPGVWTLPFSFMGPSVFREGLAGPYAVQLRLDDGYDIADTDTHVTVPYAPSDFDPPPAMLGAPHADFGNDTDVPPDGRYDALVVNVTARVFESTFVEVETYFYAIGIEASFRGTLPVGTHVISLYHAGVYFSVRGLDGPYQLRVTLELYIPGDGYWYDTDLHTTAAYRSADFDPGPAYFTPPHTDYGVDADVPPDGWYDWLAVDVSVNVTVALSLKLYGALLRDDGYFASAETIVSLPAGPATVQLLFPGERIWFGFWTGAFEVRLYLSWSQYPSLTMGASHTTDVYAWDEFQPPAARFERPHTDRGVDLSAPPDGLFDVLEVNASVNVTRARWLQVRGILEDRYGRFLLEAWASANLTPGLRAVSLRFDGHILAAHDVDGYYYVRLDLYDALGLLSSDVHYPEPYDRTAFQPLDANAPTSVASFSGYWRNGGPLRVGYAATDPAPSDGLASVDLYYRHSLDNTTWTPWSLLTGRTGFGVGEARATGTFVVDPPRGEGYYELSTTAVDVAGNVEASAAVADAALAVRIPANLVVSPGSFILVAGDTVSVTLSVVNATGAPVVLEAPLAVALATTSPRGEFRASGTTSRVPSVTILAMASEVSFDYVDTHAGGATLSAMAGLASGTSVVTVNPGTPDGIAISPPSAAIVVGTSLAFTAIVRDAYQNAIPNAPLAWSVQGGIGTITSAGVFLAGTRFGSGSVTVESGGLTTTTAVVVAPGPLDHVETLVTAGTIPVGGTATIRMEAVDAYGNLIPDAAFAWSVQGPGTLSATTGSTVALTATGEGTIHVTAVTGSLTTTVTIAAEGPGGPSAAFVGAGGAIGGLLVGFGIGWLLSRRGRPPKSAPPAEPPGKPEDETPKS